MRAGDQRRLRSEAEVPDVEAAAGRILDPDAARHLTGDGPRADARPAAVDSVNSVTSSAPVVSSDRIGDFALHALDLLPTAVIVVDGDGAILYANRSTLDLVHWERRADEVDTNILDHVHPDDIAWIADAFVSLAAQSGSDGVDRPWAPINFRIVTTARDVIPVEVTGRDAMLDPAIGGIIYEIRPAHERDIFQRVLSGVAMGGDIVSQLELILDLVDSTPVEIASAVIAFGSDGAEVVTGRSDDLHEALARAAARDELAPFAPSSPSPTFRDVATVGGALATDLGDLGYVDAWSVDVAIPVVEREYRIVAFTPVHHVPAMGVIDRLNRAAELAAVVLLRVRAESLLAHAAHHDPLTELPNRLGLKQRVAGFDADGEGLAVLFVDLDDFKAINDRHGHAVGDRVLQIVAGRLGAVIRSTDVIARLGGDEFAIVLGPSSSRPRDPQDAEQFAERILDALSDPIALDGAEHLVSASIGFVSVETGTDIEVAVAGADRAMYVAKRAGGGRAHRGDGPPSRRADDPTPR